jgi:hypothetical protein
MGTFEATSELGMHPDILGCTLFTGVASGLTTALAPTEPLSTFPSIRGTEPRRQL